MADDLRVVRISIALGVSDAEVVGRLHYLYWWALDHAEEGDLTDISAAEIAHVCRWRGDAEQLLAALLESGRGDAPGILARVEGKLVIADWYEIGGKLIDQRQASRDRTRRTREQSANAARARRGQSADGTRTVREPFGATEQNMTEQKRTEPPRQTPEVIQASAPPAARARAKATPRSLEPAYTAEFEAWWALYPKKHDKPDAFKAYRAKRNQGARAEILLTALRNFAAYLGKNPPESDQFIPLAASWLNKGKWINYRDGPPPATQLAQRTNGHRPSVSDHNAEVMIGALAKAYGLDEGPTDEPAGQ